MNNAAKRNKRIVSRGAYARLLGRKAMLSIGGVGAVVVAIACYMGVTYGCRREIPGGPFGTIVLISGCLWFAYIASNCLEAAAGLNVVPLTRANTADLPAHDSLVRASQEPMQAQEGVLLRASVGAQDQHEEQLLRAAEK